MMALAWFITGGLFGAILVVGALVYVDEQRKYRGEL